MTSCLLVRVAANQYGLPLESVSEIIPLTGVLPIPGALEAVRGVLPVRGRLVPVVHLGALMSETAAPEISSEAAVVVVTPVGTLALEVDEATDIMRDAPGAVPAGWDLPWASGVAHREGNLIPIVDIAVLAERVRPAEAEAGEPT